jgi:DNA-binding LacI/PurR family transcriptional regulator
VAGFDDAHFSHYVTPPLTTMDMLSDELWRLSMRRLIAAIDGETGLAFDAVVPRLALRASTRAR